MRKGHLRQALSLIVRTRPFLLARLAVYGVFFFATVGYTATFVLLLRAYSESTFGQILVLAVAIGLYAVARRYLARHLTNAGHAPHVQAMVETLKGNELAKGSRQIEVAIRQLDERYPETTRLFQLEAMVGRVLRDVRQVVVKAGELRPLPGFQKLGRVGALIGWLALRNVRHAVFAYTLYAAKPNFWQSARRGLLIYAQNAATVTTSATRIFLSGVLIGGVLFVIGLWPGSGLLSWGWDQGGLMYLVVLAGFVKAVWVMKNALYDPVGLAWMLSVFVRTAAETKEVDADWVEKLARSSRKFREIGEKENEMEAAAKPKVKLEDVAAKSKSEDKPPSEPDVDEDSGDEQESVEL